MTRKKALVCLAGKNYYLLSVRLMWSQLGAVCLKVSWRPWLILTSVVALVGCKPKEPEFIPPKEANRAVFVAKQYAETNGCRNATVWGAACRDGVWIISLESKPSKLATVRVSSDGQVIYYSGPR
jgi:hypothetical protein